MSDGIPVIRSLHQVPEEPVRWLWPQRVPMGKITMMVGDPGVGKSFLTADMAARVSTARDWPDVPATDRIPGDVLMLMCEDDPGDTLRPRLAAAGANLERVHILEGFKGLVDGRTAFISLDVHLDVIARALRMLSAPRLLVVDPVTAYLGRMDGNSNTEVRNVLSRLGNLARTFGVAVVVVSHLNKDSATGVKAVYRTLGALAFTAVSRVVYIVKRDAGETRVIAPVKSNLLINRDAMSFSILGDGAIGWQNTALKIDGSEIEHEDAPLSAVEEAGRWLTSLLAAGPVGSAELMDRCEREGISFAAVRRARDRVGVVSAREGFNNGRWVWKLAAPVDAQPGGPALRTNVPEPRPPAPAPAALPAGSEVRP